MVVQLRPHQREAVEKLSNGKVLVGGVGTGKTITSLVYFYEKILGGTVGDYASVKNPMDLYVFTTARKRDELDWQEEAMHVGISTHDNAGTPGVKLTVESYNNIDKYKDIKNAFIILDEQRMVGSGAWSKAFIKMAQKNQWIMLSATPGDKWEDYIPLFIANGFYKNRTAFLRQHVVYNNYGPFPKVDHYVEVGQLVRLRNHILVEMPYERHTVRHIHEIPVEYDQKLFEKVMKERWHVYENRPLKDVSELFSVMRKVANSDVSRLQTVRSLMTEHPRLIVFYNFDYELEALRELANNGAMVLSPSMQSSQQSKSSSSDLDLTHLKSMTTTSSIIGNQSTQTSTTSPASGQLKKQEFAEPSIIPNSLSGMTSILQTTKDLPVCIFPGSTTQALRSHDSTGITSSDSKLETNSTVQTMSQSSTREQPATTSCQDESHLLTGSTLERFTTTPSSQQQAMMPSTRSSRSTGSGTQKSLSEKPKLCESSNSQNHISQSLSSETDSMGRLKNSLSETKNLDGLTVRIQQPVVTMSLDKIPTTLDKVGPYVSVAEQRSHERSGKNTTTSRVVKPESWNTIEIAEWNGHKHQKVPTTDRWVYLVQYVAGAEAWNCTTTDTVVFFSLTYSYKNFVQAQGRIDRLDTPFTDLHYYVLASNSVIDKAVLKSLKNKEDFNERKFIG